MKVIYTALFGKYEELKEPNVITPGWIYICYTDQPITSNVWQIEKVLPTFSNQLTARFYKISQFRNWDKSIWVDASFTINVNLDDWWSKHFSKGFAVPVHPRRSCVYKEIDACISQHRGDRQQLLKQKKSYLERGVKANNGIITSGLLMRENTAEVIALCDEWWIELMENSTRDQVAFAAIKDTYINFINVYNWNYTIGKEFEFKPHFKNRY